MPESAGPFIRLQEQIEWDLAWLERINALGFVQDDFDRYHSDTESGADKASALDRLCSGKQLTSADKKRLAEIRDWGPIDYGDPE